MNHKTTRTWTAMLAVALALSLLLTACGTSGGTPTGDNSTPSVTETQGNTPGATDTTPGTSEIPSVPDIPDIIPASPGNLSANYLCDSRVARLGDWIFFAVRDKSGDIDSGLYKMRPDGSEIIKINGFQGTTFGYNDGPHTELVTTPLNIVGDWLYTYEGKMKAEDTQIIPYDTSIYDITAVDDPYYIKYTNPYERGVSYGEIFYHVTSGGMNPDYRYTYNGKTVGEDETIVWATKAGDVLSSIIAVIPKAYYPVLYADSDWVYLCPDYSTGLRVKTDGSGIIEEYSTMSAVNIVDGWIYYVDRKGAADNKICKMKTGGSDKSELSAKGYIQSMFVYDDWIYYSCSNLNQTNQLTKMKLDGSQSSVILEIPADNGELRVNGFAGEWIFYSTYKNHDLYRIRLDGSGNEKMDIPE